MQYSYILWHYYGYLAIQNLNYVVLIAIIITIWVYISVY